MDDEGKPLPPGTVGRIAGGKEAGFQAYAGRPIETARAFHDDLILSDDRGYLDEDGYFYVRGRVQDAVIIGDRTILSLKSRRIFVDWQESLIVVLWHYRLALAK